MDLRGNKITVGELLQNPAVTDYLKKNHRRLTPEVLNAAKTLTIEQLLGFAYLYMPKKKVEGLLADLQAL